MKGWARKDKQMEIYHVYHEEEFVGSFLQATFSTREKAEYYAKNNKYGYPESEMSVVPYILDSAVPNIELTGSPASGESELNAGLGGN